ncbi:thiamine pyrophosphate enzyme [Setomelanomma holmii]|uniref:Thiamine pyrophosphate enzyme n=1 Tax=Setomelanomma holmii TaxID=210430 RepID=A0A9P4HF91_9PLEO|nr:thiamine pyrophosphate enzyme [Setomelanomma holmii]
MGFMRLSVGIARSRSVTLLGFDSRGHIPPRPCQSPFPASARHISTSGSCKQFAPPATDPRTSLGRYTTAYAIFEGLWEAGVRNCFVNVGSDHPSVLEAFVKGKRERPNAFPRMITCPSEVTAISIADGYARVTGQPQAVLVHVDVGTQALGQGVHNASIGRVPVFILAGLCPYTESGELLGSRTEYSNWLQDAHDQTAIVRQYCRYVGEIRTGLNAKQMIGRALQFAKSAPKGPVYLTATREVLAQEFEPNSLDQEQWVPIGPSALPADAVQDIATALVHAERPLLITGYSGRDRRTPQILVKLADMIPGIRVHDTGGSDLCFPVTHPASEGFRLSMDECTKDADVVLLIDCDIPWIPLKNPPPADAKIYHVDVDPLNEQLRVSFFPAHGRWRADSFTALTQLVKYIDQDKALQDELEEPNQIMHDQLQPSRPSSWINCGATGIGWSNGAALGVKLALQDQGKDSKGDCSIVCQVVGDGSFMCAAPSSALWVASKHNIPILTVVLNNGGWKAPRNSVEWVYPDGLNKTATEDELNISFRPTPDFAALAEAAAGPEIGWMKGVRVRNVKELKVTLAQAVQRVGVEKKGMLVEVMM